jgi:hypothetical protein
MLLSLILCLSAFGIGTIFLQHTPSSRLAQVFSEHHELFNIWHYGLYITLFFSWPYFIEFIGKRQHWPDSMINYLANQRIKLSIFLILVEILLMHNALGHVITWVSML